MNGKVNAATLGLANLFTRKKVDELSQRFPETQEPNQFFVTGSDGEKKWITRAFYEEEQNVVFVEPTTVSGRFGQFSTVSKWPLKEGSTYTVLYNNTIYKCIPIFVGGEISLGNAKIYSASMPDTGEPFLITGIVPGLFSYCFFNSSQTNTFSVNGPADVIIKLPSKYLEPSIASGSGLDAVVLNGRGDAAGNRSVAENSGTANAPGSHAENYGTTNGHYSHAEGLQTVASSDYQHVQGQYNIEDAENKYAHIVGNGEYNARSNAHTLDWDGNAWFSGNVFVGGTEQDDGDKLASETFVEGKVTGAVSTKVSLPVTNSTPNYGTAGQFAVSDGNGGITWKTLVEAEGVDY